MKKSIAIVAAVILFILTGILVTKLTVHDLVQADEQAQNCAAFGVSQKFDNSFERIAIGRAHV